MSDAPSTPDILTGLTTKRTNRRGFMGHAALASLGVIGANHLNADTAAAQDPGLLNDINIFNFALNLEYVEAEFYLRAAFGRGLSESDVTGQGNLGPVFGGRPVPFASDDIRQYAEELAVDEEAHVRFLRAALGDARIRGIFAQFLVRHDGGLVTGVSVADAPTLASNPDTAAGLALLELTAEVVRVRPRTIYDASFAYDFIRREPLRVGVQFDALNLTNKPGLYNYLSVFGGTNYIPPRSMNMRLKFDF